MKKKKSPKKKSQNSESKIKDFVITEGDVSCLFLALALGISGLFAAIDKFPPWILILTIGGAWLVQHKLRNRFHLELPIFSAGAEPKKWAPYWGIILALILPLLLALVSKWGDEFPFEGDYDHHVYAGLAGLQFWKSGLVWLLAAVIGGGIAFKMKFRFWSFSPIVILLIASYWVDPPEYYFARYPAGAYFTALPWLALSQIFEWNAAINAMRLGNASSVFVWLFLLRPLLIRRPLSPGFLAFAVFLLFQRDVLLFFSSPYIEPWSLILIFMAFEIYFQDNQKIVAATLLVGLAAMFKEQSIFVIPFIWWLDLLLHRQNILRSTMAAVVAGLPFVAYYFYRKQSNIWRQVEFSSLEQAFSAERLAQGLDRLYLQFTYSGLLLPIILGILIYILLKQKARTTHFSLLVLLAAGLFQFLFLFLDQLTLDLPLYSRFYFLAFGLIAMATFLLPFEGSWSKTQIGVVLATLVSMSGSLLSGIQLLRSESYYRNSLDVPRAPEHYPIRSLIEMAERDQNLKKGDNILINHPKERFIVQSLQLGYRDIVTKYAIKTNPQTFESPACDCRQVPAHIMVPRFYHAGLLPVPAVSPERLNNELQCLEALKASCKKVYEHQLADGFVVGALGIR